jgi:signal transduction histidine kinase/ActR/RegA family two-component response regulator
MRRVRAWLAAVPGRDAVERRQGYILQAILLVLIVSFFVAAVSNGLQDAGSGSSVMANLAAAVLAVGLLALLRRGWFRLVAMLLVGLLTLGIGLSLAASGPVDGGAYLALLMLPIVIAGLLLPRPVLLITAIAVFAAGELAVRAQTAAAGPGLASQMGNFLYATILVTVAIDQFGGTVRRVLLDALAHERELEAGRAALATRTTELQAAVEALEAEIAERRRLEDEREAVQEHMLQVQRLESIGRLAGGVAHDFNNLLTAIRGYADLASTRLGPDDEPQRDLDGVRLAADQAASLTRQLLAFSRSQELRPSVVDLSAVVTKVEPLLRRLLGERIRLVVRPASDLWPVLVDPGRMESIVMNLAVNARDAMESGGTLTIETANVELDNEYAHKHAEVVPGPYAMVAVSDTGLGMDAATLDHIFEPFFTTKAVGHGTGLGLASVYGTVRQSGGHIWVYSEPSHGTTFKVYLPRTEVAGPAERAGPAAVEPRLGRELILVAEDEAFVREMIVAALEHRGYTVIAVSSGQDALDIIDRRGPEIGVLLTDVVMPGIGGLELLEGARRKRPDLRAIFMSGYTALTIDGRQIPGDVMLLEKPFTLASLDGALRELLGDRTTVPRTS